MPLSPRCDDDHEDDAFCWPEYVADRTSSVAGSGLCRPLRLCLNRWTYSYMNRVLKRGSELHRRRVGVGDDGGLATEDYEEGAEEPRRLTHDDLYRAPSSMEASFLRERFRSFYTKEKGNLVRTLWRVAAPTFVPAGFCQLGTVFAQISVPVFVWELLRILERNPSSSSVAMPYVVLIAIADVVNAFATHRQRHLAMKSGVAIRVSVVGAIYERALRLTPAGKMGLTSGSLTNMTAIDAQKLFEVTGEGHLLWSAPLSMILVAILLVVMIDPSMAVGIVILALFAPIVQRTTNRMMQLRKKRIATSDKRVEIVTGMLQGMRVTKLNNYENRYMDRISIAREKELALLRRELFVWSWIMALQFVTPILATAGAFAAYVLVEDDRVLTAADAFTSLLLFNALRFPINYASRLVGKAAQAWDSARRVSSFLERESRDGEDEQEVYRGISGEFDTSSWQQGRWIMEDGAAVKECAPSPLRSSLQRPRRPSLMVTNGSFCVGAINTIDSHANGDDWQAAGPGVDGNSFTVSGMNFSVYPGETLAVVGPVASGKSILLGAIIGEVQPSPSTIIEKRGTVAYAGQVAFVLNATLRENILFGNIYDEDRYEKVLDACCLRPDIEQFGSAGDLTEIGERGITMSGGQKQRVALARVAYSNPSIAIFDDPLSALDAATSRKIFERLFEQSGNDLLSSAAVVLVTHASHFLCRVDKVMVMVKGTMPFLGTWNELAGFETDEESAKKVIDSIRSTVQEGGDEGNRGNGAAHAPGASIDISEGRDAAASKGELMTTEMREHGITKFNTWLLWFRYAGGSLFVVILLVLFVGEKIFYFLTEWWVARWSEAKVASIQVFGKEFPPQSDGRSSHYQYLLVYAVLLVLAFVCAFLRTAWIVNGGVRCSRSLYSQMTFHVLRAPLSYFETTPLGRVLNRFTYDVETLDLTLIWTMSMLLIAISWFATALIVMAVILPWMLLAIVPITTVYWLVQLHYRKSGADLQRLDAVSRSPLQAMLAEGIDGAATIRVFSQEENFLHRFQAAADKNTSAQLNFISAQRWLGVRIELLGASIVFCAGVLVVFFNDTLGLEAGIVALLIRWSTSFTISLSFLVDNVSETEAAITSIERIQQMSELPQEKDMETANDYKVGNSWPAQGALEFASVKMRYREGLPLVLNGLSFKVQGGQRCGVVGRTGAGKSSLTAALFRLVEIESGRIMVDGVDLSKLGLSDVRGRSSGMAIIPQDPFLFAGSVRDCLDPFGNCSDDALLEALQSVRMLGSDKSAKILDNIVEEGGSNYSVGERSLLVLARAILAKPKLLVMDEATANIDSETDAFIQNMLRTRFVGTTMLTIAHRLDTIMDYDLILVMSEGKAVEIGSPNSLIESSGVFEELINATGDGATALKAIAASNI